MAEANDIVEVIGSYFPLKRAGTAMRALCPFHREKSPFYVQLDGKELPHFLHRRKFEEAESGWYYSQRLKSVQVKYPNPKKDHEIMVSFEQFDLIGM